MRKLVLYAGIPLLILGLGLHASFMGDSNYSKSFLDTKACNIYLSSIFSGDFDKSKEDNCQSQYVLVKALFVKLFIALGVLLIGSGLFLIYSGIDKKDTK